MTSLKTLVIALGYAGILCGASFALPTKQPRQAVLSELARFVRENGTLQADSLSVGDLHAKAEEALSAGAPEWQLEELECVAATTWSAAVEERWRRFLLAEYADDFGRSVETWVATLMEGWAAKEGHTAVMFWQISSSGEQRIGTSLAVFDSDSHTLYDSVLSGIPVTVTAIGTPEQEKERPSTIDAVDPDDQSSVYASARVYSLLGAVTLHWRVDASAEVSAYIAPVTNDGELAGGATTSCWKSDPTGIPPTGTPVLYFGLNGTKDDEDDPFESWIQVTGAVDHFHDGTYRITHTDGAGGSWLVSFGVSYYGSLSITPPPDTTCPISLRAPSGTSGRQINVTDKVYGDFLSGRYKGVFYDGGNVAFDDFILRIEDGGTETGSCAVSLFVNGAYAWWDIIPVLQDVIYVGGIALHVDYVRGNKVPDPGCSATANDYSVCVGDRTVVTVTVQNRSTVVSLEEGQVSLDTAVCSSVLDIIGPATQSLGTIPAGGSRNYYFTLEGSNVGSCTPQASVTGRWGWPASDAGKTFSRMCALDRVIAVSRPCLSVSPSGGLDSSGCQGGPFSPSSKSYTLSNATACPFSWQASPECNWVSVSPSSGTLSGGGSRTVTLSLNGNANGLASGTHTCTVCFRNLTNNCGDHCIQVRLTVEPPGRLEVSQASDLDSSGCQGGPFTPTTKTYTLTNTGACTINYSVSPQCNWVSPSSSSGSLSAGQSTSVTISLNGNANGLSPGSHTCTVLFTNTTNGSGNTSRQVSLTVYEAACLELSPAGDLQSSGCQGGPFSPSQTSYTIRNTGSSQCSAMSWSATKDCNWVDVTPSGSVPGGQSSSVTVQINSNANNLSPGTHTCTVSFRNDTNGCGNTSRSVTLVVDATACLEVSPQTDMPSDGCHGGPFDPSQTSYTIGNTGSSQCSAMSWSATKDCNWVDVTPSSGSVPGGQSNSVTVRINSNANSLSPGTHTCTVNFRNDTNHCGDDSRTVTLVVGDPACLQISPSGGLDAAGCEGGPFDPNAIAYTLTNTGSPLCPAVSWSASADCNWVTISPSSGSVSGGQSASVTVRINSNANALASGDHSGTVTFSADRQICGPPTRSVALTVVPGPCLAVSPAGGLTPSGCEGGPFVPDCGMFTVRNIGCAGGSSIGWTAATDRNWISVSPASGSLNIGQSRDVEVCVNANAANLPPGTHVCNVTFTNTTDGCGNTSRSVTLTVDGPGCLAVSPAGPFASSACEGAEPNPGSKTYTINNTGGASCPPISWSATPDGDWVDVTPSQGQLAGGANRNVVLSLNSNAQGLSEGTHECIVTFANMTNGCGDTSRNVSLAIDVPPDMPAGPSPQDDADTVSTGTTLDWADASGATKYDLYLDTACPPSRKVAEDWPDSRYDPGDLACDETYCWRVVAKNDCASTEGPVWRLSTGPCPTVEPRWSPNELDFGTSSTSLTFEAWNAAEAEGDWTFDVLPDPDASWLSVSPDTGSSSGSSDRQTVTVTVDRTGLSPGTYNGEIILSGETPEDAVVPVRMEVGCACGAVGPLAPLGMAIGFLLLARIQHYHGWARRRRKQP